MTAETNEYKEWYEEVDKQVKRITGFGLFDLPASEDIGSWWVMGFTPQEAAHEYIKEAVSDGNLPQQFVEESLHSQ